MKQFPCLFLLLFIQSLFSSDVRADVVPKEKPLFIHSVYFWLQDDVTESEKKQFMDLLKSFRKIKSVSKVIVATPAGTKRAVVDNTYDVALIVVLKDKAAHDYYQADKIHTDAIKIFEGWINRLQIYDAVTTRDSSMIYN